MRIPDLTLTTALRWWLRHEHDDGTPQLVVRQIGWDVVVEREDGTELSAREKAGVRGLVAAHREKPLRHPGGRPRMADGEARTVKLTARYTEDEAAELTRAAEARSETVADLVRRASLAAARRKTKAK